MHFIKILFPSDYEAKWLGINGFGKQESHLFYTDISVEERCANLRKRRAPTNQCDANAIFFRSKLSLPLSPSTPALIVDIIDNIDVEGDRSVYISMYDMTYRHFFESSWVQQIKDLLEQKNDVEMNVDEKSYGLQDEQGTVTNVSILKVCEDLITFLSI